MAYNNRLFVCLLGLLPFFCLHSADIPYIGVWKSDVFASVSFLLNWINIAIYEWFVWVRHPKLDYSNVAIKRYVYPWNETKQFFSPFSPSLSLCVCVDLMRISPFLPAKTDSLKSESSEGNGRQCQLKNEIELSWVNKHLYSRICLNEQTKVCTRWFWLLKCRYIATRILSCRFITSFSSFFAFNSTR